MTSEVQKQIDEQGSLIADRRKELVEKMITLMETGEFNHRSEWNRYAFRPYNPLSDAVYRGGNRLRLMVAAILQGYDDPRWVTFKQCSDAGYMVRNGEHGVACEKWIFTRERVMKDEQGHTIKDKDGKPMKETVYLERPSCRWFVVFNAAQIEGFPRLEMPVHDADQELDEVISQLLDTSECPVTEKPQGRAYYSHARDEIILPPRQVFKDQVSFAKTLLHEMGHSTGHESRLNRELKNEFGSEKYALEELRAELGALFTEADLGIVLNAEHYEDHSDYLRSWIGALRNDYNELFRACRDADLIACRLVENYTRKYTIKYPVEKDIESEKLSENIPAHRKYAGKHKR